MKPIEQFYEESRVKTATRLAILRAAVGFICENHIADLTMQAVAERAGLTMRNVYRYYENRNDLLMDTFYYIFSSYGADAPLVFPPDAPGDVQLERVIDHYFVHDRRLERTDERYGVTQGDVLRLLFEIDFFLFSLPENDPAFARYRTRYVVHINTAMKRQLRAALEAGIRDGTLHLRAEEIPFFMEHVIQSMRSIRTQVVLKGNERDTINDRLIETTADMILCYLRSERREPLPKDCIPAADASRPVGLFD